jgi:hypothetical protein
MLATALMVIGVHLVPREIVSRAADNPPPHRGIGLAMPSSSHFF